MSDPPAPRSFALRIWGCARLHADTYEEVEADASSISQAFVVVLAASLAAATGGLLRSNRGAPLAEGILEVEWFVLVVAIEPLVVWIVGAVFAYMLGATFFKGPETETDYAEVLRTTGFAFGPGVLAAFAWVSPEWLALSLVALYRVWIPVAWVIAVRQALDFTTLRALGTFAFTALLLWLVAWGLSVAPIPL